MLVVKLISTISPVKEYFEFPRITVACGAWKECNAGEHNGRAFFVTDEEVTDKELCKPNIYFPDLILDTPEDDKIVNILVGRDENNVPIKTIAIGDGLYSGFIMQDGKTIDRL